MSKKGDSAASLTVHQRPNEKPDRSIARAALRPTVQSAVTLAAFDRRGPALLKDRDLNELVEALREQTTLVSQGRLERGEGMLTAQAHTLDAIFNVLARRAAANMGEYLDAAETYLRLALRAQAQCRATWEAISAIQNPPIAGYVGQANIASGPQQVNNAINAAHSAGAQENRTEQSKLLERKERDQNEQWLDRGTARAAAPGDSAVEAVGEVARAEDGRREGEGRG
jgi:hypothetical protein